MKTDRSDSDLMGLDHNAYGQLVPQRQWADREPEYGMPDTWVEDFGPIIFICVLLGVGVVAVLYAIFGGASWR